MFALVAAAPLANADLPCSDDAPFHLFRAVELGSLIELGHWLPRWAPHMAQGYGYPFFNFYAPLSSYLVVALHGLAGLAYPAALKAAFMLGLWLAGLAAFWFARAGWGTHAGVAAGAAYVLTPYLAYDVLFRGNLAESFAFVWPPLVLLALRRATAPEPRRGQAWAAIVGALAYAALILTHNIFALIASPLFAGYGLLRTWQARSWRRLAVAALSLAAGIGLTAFFWLPAIVERNWVHSDRLLVPPSFTWYTNFVSPGELLALPRVEDPQLINPSPWRGVGAVTAALCLPALLPAGLGAASKGRKREELGEARRQLAPVTFFALALVGYSGMTLAASAPVWRLIQPLALVQFPWRMLGPAALCSAVLVGAGVASVERWLAQRAGGSWTRAMPLAVALGIVFVASLTAWYPRYCPTSASAGLAELVAFERATGTIGTTAKGEYLPRTAISVPADTKLAEALLRGEEPHRLYVPDDAGVVSSAAARDPLDANFEVTASRAVEAVYQQLYYPGWRIELDGEPAVIRPVAEGPRAGLIAFDLPAGSHAIQVRFGSTPLRQGASLASGLAAGGLLGAAVVLWLGRGRQGPDTHAPRTGKAAPLMPEDSGQGVGLVALVGLLVAAKFALIDQVPNPLRQPALDASALPLSGTLGNYPRLTDFAGGIRLHGYDLSATRLPADGALDAAWYVSRWEASEARYWPAFRVEDAAGLTWHDPETLQPLWPREPPPTRLWPLDQYARWARHVTLLPGTPPGTYTLTGEVFDLDTLRLASALDAAGNAVAPRLALDTLVVERPQQPWRLPAGPGGALRLGPITLLGAELSQATANAGDTIRLTLYWRSEAPVTEDSLAQLALTPAGAASPALVLDLPPVEGYGLSHWQPGDNWRGQHRLRLPAALPSGDYAFALRLAGVPGAADLGHLAVTAPPRRFEPPGSATPVGAAFEGVGTLAGFTLTQTHGALAVTLVWQAAETPRASYHVFVHLEGDGGRVWAQSDAAPAGWTRPTTGWLAGEYIVDEHHLAWAEELPAGVYTLHAGLYDPQTGLRVLASGPGAAPDQRVTIGQFTR